MARRNNGRLAGLLAREALHGYALIAPPVMVVGGLMLLPVVHLLAVSFAKQTGFQLNYTWTLSNYAAVFTDPLFRTLLARSLWISATTTVLTLLVAFPLAYHVAFYVHRRKLLWIVLLTTPAWTSYLLRVFAWKVILGYDGIINSGLLMLGVVVKPMSFLVYNPVAVVITLAHAWTPFALLPIYISLERSDRSLIEAAADLGEGPVGRFLRVTLPISLPGVTAAAVMIFIPTVGDYITPQLVGGPDGLMIANVIAAYFGRIHNWPLGSAMSVVSILATMAGLLAYLGLVRAGRRLTNP